MTRTVSRPLRAALFCVASVVGFVHLLTSGGPRKATVNIESAIAVLFVLCLAIPIRKPHHQLARPQPGPSLWPWIPLVALPFLITVRAPLLYDSYVHVVDASRRTGAQLLAVFYRHPTSGDFFFRPLGYSGYWLEEKWAGFSSAIWHADGILLHVAACALLYGLARRLDLTPAASLVTVLFFGLHAGNPEVVTWTAARFDEDCTCFVLASLLFLCRYLDNRTGFFWMLLAALCAMLSKEAAFCLPALALCIVAYKGPRFDRTVWKAFSGLAALEIAALGYRSWVLRGIGGYGAASGDPLALHFNFPRFVELLFFRMWSVLLFPINWSSPLEWWAMAGVLAGLLGLSLLIAVANPPARKVIAALVFCWMALLPASSLGLLDATILGARVYRLALIGLAILFGTVADAIDQRMIKALVAGSVLALQASVLCHNLLLWRDTARLAGTVCRNFPQMIDRNRPVVLEDLPREHNGVFFLANAFGACVYVNSGTDITILTAAPRDSGIPRFRWDKESQSLARVAPDAR